MISSVFRSVQRWATLGSAKRQQAWRAAVAGVALLLTGCVEPYAPAVLNAPQSLLVVDGFLNTTGVSTIRLSRTYNLQDPDRPPVESKATMYLESDNGASYQLQETTAGTYASADLQLSPQRTYRLHFTTAAGDEYASEYATPKVTPPIDSVTWHVQADGVQISVSAHDNAGATQYYRWLFEETYQFTSAYFSIVKYENGQFLPRNEDIYHCWATNAYTNINLTNTLRLSRDVVDHHPLLFLPTDARQFQTMFSLLVRQQALSKEEYDYLTLLQKNTQNIGTLFDPLPVQLTGNVRSLTHPDEDVLGFVGVHSEEQQRIFISRRQLPPAWRTTTGYEMCMPPDTVDPMKYDQVFGSGDELPIYLTARGYVGGGPSCIDCRLRGTTVKPDFWP